MSQLVLSRLQFTDWPYLPPPVQLGQVTVVDVYATSGREEYADCMREWASTTWAAWSAHHDTVRRWAAIAVSRPV